MHGFMHHHDYSISYVTSKNEAERPSAVRTYLLFSLRTYLLFSLRVLKKNSILWWLDNPKTLRFKKETSHVGRKKPPNPIFYPHTRARNPVSGPVLNLCFWKTQSKRGEFFFPPASVNRPRGSLIPGQRFDAGALDQSD